MMAYRILLILLLVSIKLKSQCTIVSSCGYSVTLSYGQLAIVPSTTNCPFGFNYNVSFSYSITVKGVNTCYNSNIGIQPQILCGGTNNGYYTINVPAPTVGNPFLTTNFSGTLVTGSNPFISTATCNSASPVSLSCNALQVTMFGPNISGTFTCNIVTLPIELLYFNSSLTSEVIVLDWATVTETNNDFFTIEKSIDALNFYELGKVQGKGNSVSTNYYSLTDSNPSIGINYYRLKQTDFNKQFKYSSIISQDYQSAIHFSVFPNPLEQGSSLTIKFSENQNTPLDLMIYDNLGQLILQKSIIPTNQNEIKLNELSIPAGLYIIKLKSETRSSFVKLIIE